MSTPQSNNPALKQIEVQGITRQSFVLKGALGHGAVFGFGAVGPLRRERPGRQFIERHRHPQLRAHTRVSRSQLLYRQGEIRRAERACCPPPRRCSAPRNRPRQGPDGGHQVTRWQAGRDAEVRLSSDQPIELSEARLHARECRRGRLQRRGAPDQHEAAGCRWEHRPDRSTPRGDHRPAHI